MYYLCMMINYFIFELLIIIIFLNIKHLHTNNVKLFQVKNFIMI